MYKLYNKRDPNDSIQIYLTDPKALVLKTPV